MVCGKSMLMPLMHQFRLRPVVCDDCKAVRKAANIRKATQRRKAERAARRQEAGVPECLHCGKPIEGAARFAERDQRRLVVYADGTIGFTPPPPLARKYCGNTCRQAAFRRARREARIGAGDPDKDGKFGDLLA
jgi:hypothetical protein